MAAVASWRGRIGARLGSETAGQLPVLVIVAALTIVFVLPPLIDPTMGGLPIRGYGVMLLAVGRRRIALSQSIARGRIGLDPEIILSLATWFFISGIVGARLFYVIEYWPKFQKPTLSARRSAAIVNLTQGGLVVYGSLLAGGAALIVFIYKNQSAGPGVGRL